MDYKRALFRFAVFILLFILSIVIACSTPSWFPIKKGSPHKAKMKELLDKEVVILDKEEYVKVLNPRSAEEKIQPKYLYIPVNEYLAKRETFTFAAIPKQEVKKEPAVTSTSSIQLPRSPGEKEPVRISAPEPKALKKK